MDALNWLRAVLVGCALVAAVLLLFDGQWVPAGVLFAGIAAHFWLFAHLRGQRRREVLSPDDPRLHPPGA